VIGPGQAPGRRCSDERAAIPQGIAAFSLAPRRVAPRPPRDQQGGSRQSFSFTGIVAAPASEARLRRPPLHGHGEV